MNWKEYKLEGWDGISIKRSIDYQSIDILLLDISFSPSKKGRKNLLGVDKRGIIKWIAELPKEQHDMYAEYDFIEPKDDKFFKAWSGSSYCEIEIDTGEIVLEQFVK